MVCMYGFDVFYVTDQLLQEFLPDRRWFVLDFCELTVYVIFFCKLIP